MAKNYNLSDYALNKYSESMVYSGVDGSSELTIEAFLASDSTLTEADFAFWKQFSDSDYRETAKRNTFESKHTVPLTEIEDTVLISAESTEDKVLEEMEPTSNPYSYENAMRVLDKCLTKTQKRRYLMYKKGERNLEAIAEEEGVTATAVFYSITAAEKNISNFLSLHT